MEVNSFTLFSLGGMGNRRKVNQDGYCSLSASAFKREVFLGGVGIADVPFPFCKQNLPYMFRVLTLSFFSHLRSQENFSHSSTTPALPF